MVVKYNIIESDIWNFDKTGFFIGQIISIFVITSYNRCRKAKTIQFGNWKWVIIVQSINFSGWAMPPFIIMVGQNHLED